jgi:putative RNA 2'-phosphotransferase
MTGRQRLMLSKLMSALLRHIPWEAGLRVDEEGWIHVDELVKGIRERWRNRALYSWVTRDHVIAVALLDPKGRFELSPNADRIRAVYGHSIRVRIKYRVEENPPTQLYHATPKENVKSILSEGLKPMKRLYVHLALNPSDALEAGFRHGREVVLLSIDTRCLKAHGIPVLRASPRIFLVERVPPGCIKPVNVFRR